MNIPNLINSPITDSERLNYSWLLWFSQLVTELQNNLSNNGYVIPSLTTIKINALDISNNKCILVRDSDTDELKVSLGGTFKVIQVV
jgi:predicted nuclease of predicted toxin-antitoxin system